MSTVPMTVCDSENDSRHTSVQPLTFNGHVQRIRNLLQTLPGSTPEVVAAVNDLRECFSKPPVEIVAGGVWGEKTDLLIVKTHLKSVFEDAVESMRRCGKEVSVADQCYLRYILSHPCGWSPTAAEQSQNAWMRYLQTEYAHLENLQPILDSFTWPEELVAYPDDVDPPRPSLFLLATSGSFYVYDFENQRMYRAGISTKEVYFGLKDKRYRGDKNGDWDQEPRSLDIDSAPYFPVYHRIGDDGFVLELPLKEFTYECTPSKVSTLIEARQKARQTSVEEPEGTHGR